MNWSRLKSQVESRFSDKVKGRVELRSTRYRRAHDQDGRAWITIDKKEIINMSTVRAWGLAFWAAYHYSRVEHPNDPDAGHRGWDPAKENLHKQSIFWQTDLGQAMFDYLNLSMREILASDNILIRALGMLDARLGKRRALALDVENEHPLVRRLHAFRCEAEGWRPTA
jgi:hypothetical protein